MRAKGQDLGVKGISSAADEIGRRGLLRLGAACALSFLAACGPKSKVVRIEREEIQARLDEKFPIETTKFLIEIVLRDPRVDLRPGEDKIGLSVDVVARPPLLASEFPGKISARGSLEYDKEEKAFYLREAEIEKLTIEGVPEKYADKVRVACEELAKHTLAKTPVYRLTGRNLKEVAASYVLRDVRVKDGALEVELGPPF